MSAFSSLPAIRDHRDYVADELDALAHQGEGWDLAVLAELAGLPAPEEGTDDADVLRGVAEGIVEGIVDRRPLAQCERVGDFVETVRALRRDIEAYRLDRVDWLVPLVPEDELTQDEPPAWRLALAILDKLATFAERLASGEMFGVDQILDQVLAELDDGTFELPANVGLNVNGDSQTLDWALEDGRVALDYWQGTLELVLDIGDARRPGNEPDGDPWVHSRMVDLTARQLRTLMTGYPSGSWQEDLEALEERERRMDGGELQARREHLGLTGDALAGLLRVNPRTVRSWEAGRDPIPGRVREEIEALEAETAAAVDELVTTLSRAAEPAALVYRTDADLHRERPDLTHLPARWWRHVVARAAAEVPGVAIRTAPDTRDLP